MQPEDPRNGMSGNKQRGKSQQQNCRLKNVAGWMFWSLSRMGFGSGWRQAGSLTRSTGCTSSRPAGLLDGQRVETLQEDATTAPLTDPVAGAETTTTAGPLLLAEG
jgi:hypothetical protein